MLEVLTYFKLVSVDLVIQSAKPHAPYYIIICGVSVSIMFSYVISKMQGFAKTKIVFSKFRFNICKKSFHSKKNSTR